MAITKFSRSARSRGRAGGNHPRTHPIIPALHPIPTIIKARLTRTVPVRVAGQAKSITRSRGGAV